MPTTEAELAEASARGPLKGRELRLLWVMPFWPTPSNPTALTPARDVALLLARAGHSVVALGMSDEQPEPSLSQHPNLVEVPVVRPGDGPKRQALGARMILRQARAFHREQPFDLAFVRFAHPIGVTGAIVAGALGIPLVYQEEAPDLELVTRRRIERFSMSTMKHRAAMRLASGPTIAQGVQEIIDRPVYPIPYVIDVDRFVLPPRRLGPAAPVRLIAVGRVHEQKGTTTLLDAMAKLPQRFSLDLVGDGSGRAAAEAQVHALGIEDRVHFRGFCPPAQVPGFMRDAHVFVLPSTHESFCVAVAEGLAAGLPVVTTRCGGPEFFVTPDDGRVVEPRDPIALAEAILEVGESYDSFDSAAIARRARERFGPVAALSVYESMFAATLGLAPIPEPGPFGPFWFA